MRPHGEKDVTFHEIPIAEKSLSMSISNENSSTTVKPDFWNISVQAHQKKFCWQCFYLLPWISQKIFREIWLPWHKHWHNKVQMKRGETFLDITNSTFWLCWNETSEWFDNSPSLIDKIGTLFPNGSVCWNALPGRNLHLQKCFWAEPPMGYLQCTAQQ